MTNQNDPWANPAGRLTEADLEGVGLNPPEPPKMEMDAGGWADANITVDDPRLLFGQPRVITWTHGSEAFEVGEFVGELSVDGQTLRVTRDGVEVYSQNLDAPTAAQLRDWLETKRAQTEGSGASKCP